MGIFGSKKKTEEKVDAAKEAKPVKEKKAAAKKPAKAKAVKAAVVKTATPVSESVVVMGAASVVIRPRVTEKSGLLSQSNIYTFEIEKDANKNSVAKAMKALYKVEPVKVAVINTPAKSVFVKGKRGTVAGFKKAIVTLKKGDKIDFV